MKDLYTFDYSIPSALETYHQVREAYTRIFDELKLPYLVADADSGNMGGNLSHEFHFPTPNGEDNVISCTSCGYVANEELAESALDVPKDRSSAADGASISQSDIKPLVWRGISRDRQTLINVWFSADPSQSDPPEINLHALKSAMPDFDASVEDPLPFWTEVSKSSPPSKNLQIHHPGGGAGGAGPGYGERQVPPPADLLADGRHAVLGLFARRSGTPDGAVLLWR